MPSIFTTCFVKVQCHSVFQSSWLFRRPFYKRFPHQNVVLILYLYYCNHLTSPSKFQCHYNNVSTCYSNNVENCSTVSWITLLNQRRQVERLNPVTSAHKNSAFWVPKIALSWKIFFCSSGSFLCRNRKQKIVIKGHWQLILPWSYNFVPFISSTWQFVLQISLYENVNFTIDVICPGCYYNGRYYNFNEAVKINCNLWWVTANSTSALQTGGGTCNSNFTYTAFQNMFSAILYLSLYFTFVYCKHQSVTVTLSCTVIRLQWVKP